MTTPIEEQNDELPQELSSYLLLIHELLEEKGYVRGVELAERLQMSRPTVTRAIQRLAALGFANYERYRGITLSPAGKAAAEDASSRYKVVHGFFAAVDVDMANMQLEARRLAASASDDVLRALAVAAKRLKN